MRRLDYWLSSKAMTIEVTIAIDLYDKEIIIEAPPIARKFIGQELNNLIGWMKKQGDFKMECISDE